MFDKLSSVFSGLKGVEVDKNTSHLSISDTDIHLTILRPYDLVALGGLVGSGSEDILVWVGKTIGKKISQEIFKDKPAKKLKKKYKKILSNYSYLGFGDFDMDLNEGKSVEIEVEEPLEKEIKDKEDARVICNLYNGLFIGMLEEDYEVEESGLQTVLDSEPGQILNKSVYKYNLAPKEEF